MRTMEQEIANLQQLVRGRPRDAAVHRQLGNMLLAGGSPAEAAASYKRAIKLEPDNVRAHNNLGQALMRLGEPAAAVRSFKRAIALDPSYAIAHNNFGIALQSQGFADQAIDSYRHAIELQPSQVEAYFNCATALISVGRLAEALSRLEQAIALNPQFVDALVCRGNVLQQVRRFEAALSDYRRALQIQPQHAEARSNAANALNELKRSEEALSYCDEAIRLQPDFAPAHNNRAGALRALHRYEESLASCDRALALEPDYVEALCNRGKLLRETGEHLHAEESFRRALALNPDQPEARVGLLMSLIPTVPLNEGEVQTARAAFATELGRFDEWLAQKSSNLDETTVVGVSQPFFLAYHEDVNRALLEPYGKLCCDLMARWQTRNLPPDLAMAAVNTPPASVALHAMSSGPAPIRVGIVSAQVRDHSVYQALTKGWLDQLDRRRFEVGVFHLGIQRDSETDWAEKHTDFFVAGDRTLAEWAQAIRQEHVDILIYPEVGMDPTTLRLASMRLARQQVAAWGHPETTGLPTIDYYLSAELFEGPQSQACYTERLVPLAHLGCYYEPYDVVPAACDFEKIGIDRRLPVLLCPGMPFKYAPRHDGVLVEIARRLGPCQLVLFEPQIPSLSQKLRDRLGAAFGSQNLQAADYLVFIPWLSRPEFFGLLSAADVYLDTIGFSGFNTASQAVQCGLPLATHESRFMRGRLASAIMRRMELPELVTAGHEEYVRLAVRLVRDRPFREEMRARLLSSRSLLFRDRAAIDGLSEFLSGVAANGSYP